MRSGTRADDAGEPKKQIAATGPRFPPAFRHGLVMRVGTTGQGENGDATKRANGTIDVAQSVSAYLHGPHGTGWRMSYAQIAETAVLNDIHL